MNLQKLLLSGDGYQVYALEFDLGIVSPCLAGDSVVFLDHVPWPSTEPSSPNLPYLSSCCLLSFRFTRSLVIPPLETSRWSMCVHTK